MTDQLPELCLDQEMLTQIEHALGIQDGGYIAGEFTLTQLLEFYSGYDPAEKIDMGGGMYEYPHATYHVNDLVAALVAEVRRLRRGDPS